MRKDTAKYMLLIIFIIAFNNVVSQEYEPTYFSKTKVLEDLSFLKEKVINIHPKFLDKEYTKQWDEQYTLIVNNIPDSLTLNKSYIIFASLLSNLQDGHSNFSFHYNERVKYMKNSGGTMPLTTKIKGNKIFISEYFAKPNQINYEGCEILSINGIRTDSILNRLHLFFGAKKISITNNNIEKYFGAYFWTAFGEFRQYEIEIARNEKPLLLKLNPVTNSEYFSLKNQLHPKRNDKKYELLFFDNHDFAYMRIKSFANKKVFSEFAKESFNTIKTIKCKNLVIDIRDNFGGTSGCVDTLLSYLTSISYRQYASIGLRISEEIKEKYKIRNPELYEKIVNLTDTIFYYNENILEKEPVFRDDVFSGNIFILINEKTFSAAATFAGVIKQYKLGKIVGATETGGTIEYYGDFLFFQLPYTKMDFFISPKIFVQLGGSDLNKGVSPNIVVQEDENIKILLERLKMNANNGFQEKY